MVFTNQPNDLDRLEETIAVLGYDALIRQLTESEGDLAADRVGDADTLAAAMRSRKSRS
jgi:hypothetical protein